MEQLRLTGELARSIAQIELAVGREVKDWTSYPVGAKRSRAWQDSGLTIALETGPDHALASAGTTPATAVCGSQRVVQREGQGANNGRTGTGIWPGRGVEAAAVRAADYYGRCRRFSPERRGRSTGRWRARRWPASWQGGWHVMREGVPFDWSRAFPGGVRAVNRKCCDGRAASAHPEPGWGVPFGGRFDRAGESRTAGRGLRCSLTTRFTY